MKQASCLTLCLSVLLVTACGDDGGGKPKPGDDEQDPPVADTMDGSITTRDGSIDSSVTVQPDGSILVDAGFDAGNLSIDGGVQDGAVTTLDAATDSAVPDATAPADTCKDGFARGPVNATRRTILEAKPTIEGVAVCPNGQLFVTAASVPAVWRVPLDGAAKEVWSTQEEGMYAGITCDSTGRLFVADFGSGSAGAVVMVAEKDKVIVLSNPDDDDTSGYNGILAVKGVGVYASDTTAGRVVLQREIAPGSWKPSVVATDVNGANGLALGANGRLYLAVSNFLGGDNQVLSWSIGAEGVLNDRKVEWEGPNVVDGVAIDEKGEIYVALYSEGKIVKVSNGSTVATTDNPASLAFKGGMLFYTDYDVVGSQLETTVGGILTTGWLYAIDLGVCGAN